MSPCRRLDSRLRTLLALLALAANLLAAGGPLLHAAAHLGGHGEQEHAESSDALAGISHAHDDHGALHPASLHDEASAVKSRGGNGFALVARADLPLLRIIPHERRDLPVPAPRLSSRAPPPGDPARAPPLA
jgi:hypothetical protein